MKITGRLLTVLIIAVAVVNTGCDGDSATSDSSAITTAQVDRTSAAATTDTPARIAQAQATYEESVRLGFGWTTTPALIDAAKRALDAGNDSEAAVFAQHALLEAEAAVQQAKYSDTHWQALIPN
tara:strand:+ start:1042 stop:1416 length:375 start_codon:yes stop_codon:yes gene_type:complete